MFRLARSSIGLGCVQRAGRLPETLKLSPQPGINPAAMVILIHAAIPPRQYENGKELMDMMLDGTERSG